MYPGQTVEPDTVMLVSQGQITAVLLLDSSSSFLSLFLPFFCFFCFFFFPFLLFLPASRRGLLFFSSCFGLLISGYEPKYFLRVFVKEASQKISLAVGMRTQLSHIRICTLHGAPWSKLSIKDKVCHVTAELRLSYLTKSSSESGCVMFLIVCLAYKFKL